MGKEGWIMKQGGKIKSWKKRWFILNGLNLNYYDKKGGKEAGSINLKTASEVSLAPDCKKQPAFKIVTPDRTYYLSTESSQEASDWIKAIGEARKDSSAKSVAASVPQVAPKKITLDDFEIISVLGRGGYGKVQLVRFKEDGQLYALKSMSKHLIEESGQIQQTLTERDVLLKTVHPFLVGAHHTFQTAEKIFLVLDYVPGGELFGRLKEEERFSESRVRLYAAEILLGLGQLHSLGFVYRDLKPENILVDAEGHLKITDFGLAKGKMNSGATTTTFCGTPEYVAPEMLRQEPYTKSVDWWSYGILIYEMLTGLPPFFDENTNRMYQMILKDDVVFPDDLSPDVQDLISKLLNKYPQARLGAGPKDFEDIKAHKFFSSLQWDKVLAKKYTPEWKPHMKNATDTSNFDEEFTAEPNVISYEDPSLIGKKTQAEFEGFTCTQDSLF